MYLALFYGRRFSPANWGLIATLLMQLEASFRPRNEYTDGPESPIAYQYVDEGAFVDPMIGIRHRQAVSLLEYGWVRCLGTRALHRKKLEAEGNTATKIPMWGIVVCADAGTFAAPRGKIDRVREFLATIDYDPGVARISLRRLQELRGKLEHLSVRNASLACETPMWIGY